MLSREGRRNQDAGGTSCFNRLRISAAGRAAGGACRRAGRWGWRGTPSRRGWRASSPGPFRPWAPGRRGGTSRISPDWTPPQVPCSAGRWRSARRRGALSGRRCWTAGHWNRACVPPSTGPGSRCGKRRRRGSAAGRRTGPRKPGKRSWPSYTRPGDVIRRPARR